MKKFAVWCALVLGASQAGAAGVGVRAGTTGVGADVAFGVAPLVSARLGYSAFNYSRNYNDSDFKYDGKLQLKNVSLLLDVSPPVVPFRVSAGVVSTGNKVDVVGTPANNFYTINGHQYASADVSSVTGQIKGQRSTAPYLGIGWGNVSGAGVNFYGDLGVMFMGGGKSSLDAQCAATASGTALCGSQEFKDNVAAERQKLQDDVKSFKYFTVINIGVTFGF